MLLTRIVVAATVAAVDRSFCALGILCFKDMFTKHNLVVIFENKAFASFMLLRTLKTQNAIFVECVSWNL